MKCSHVKWQAWNMQSLAWARAAHLPSRFHTAVLWAKLTRPSLSSTLETYKWFFMWSHKMPHWGLRIENLLLSSEFNRCRVISRSCTLKLHWGKQSHTKTKAIDVLVLLQCILFFYNFFGKYFGTRKALRKYELKHTEIFRALVETLS